MTSSAPGRGSRGTGAAGTAWRPRQPVRCLYRGLPPRSAAEMPLLHCCCWSPAPPLPLLQVAARLQLPAGGRKGQRGLRPSPGAAREQGAPPPAPTATQAACPSAGVVRWLSLRKHPPGRALHIFYQHAWPITCNIQGNECSCAWFPHITEFLTLRGTQSTVSPRPVQNCQVVKKVAEVLIRRFLDGPQLT